MKSEELRTVFTEAASGTPPVGPSVADTIAAGRRSVRRRRLAGGSVVTGAAVLALAGTVALAPWANGSGPDDAADPPTGCQAPSGAADGQADATAVMYGKALNTVVGEALDGDLGYIPYENREGGNWGFFFETEPCAYVFEQYAVFGGSKVDGNAPFSLLAEVYEPGSAPIRERMEELAGCAGIVADSGGECDWTDHGALRVDYTTQTQDGDDEPQDRQVRRVLTIVGDRVVSVTARLDGSQAQWITFARLTQVADAIPVGETPPPLPERPDPITAVGDEEKVAAFKQAVAEQVPGGVLTPADGLGFEPLSESEGRALAATLTMPDGEVLTITAEVWTTDDDGANHEEALTHWAGCETGGDAECTYHDNGDIGVMVRHEGPEVSVWESRTGTTENGNGFIFAVRAAPADGSDEVSLSVEQIGAIVAAIP